MPELSMSPSPELHSKFMECMLQKNRPRMDGFKKAGFSHLGMRFQAVQKWWGNQGPRAVPHEGLDLYCFEEALWQGKNRGSTDPNPGGVCRSGGKNRPGFSGKIHLYKPCDLCCRRPPTFIGGGTHRPPGRGSSPASRLPRVRSLPRGGGISRQKIQPPAPRTPHVCLGAGGFQGGSAYLEKSGP